VSSGIGMGLLPASAIEGESEQAGARILLVEDQERAAQRVVGTLGKAHGIDVETDVARALLRLGEEAYDVALISLGLAGADGLRLCSQVRSFERLRHLPIVVIVEPGDDRRLLRALDMGVNDYLTRPIDRQELIARVRTQLRRKRRSDHLRKCLDASVGLAVTDPLTGLSNRRHLEGHLTVLVERARSSGQPLSVLMADIDHFKSVNDAYGHAAGDAVLREFAQRLRRNVRAVDLVCRLGGEEFIIVMPNTSEELARDVGQRVCACIAEEAFQIDQSTRAGVTASVGLATLDAAEVEADALLRRADQALYRAKRAGRNRVVAHAA
jgi:two-component system cell cycle response regulator